VVVEYHPPTRVPHRSSLLADALNSPFYGMVVFPPGCATVQLYLNFVQSPHVLLLGVFESMHALWGIRLVEAPASNGHNRWLNPTRSGRRPKNVF